MRKPRFEKFCFKKEQRTEVVARTEWRRTEVCVCVCFLNFLIIFFFSKREILMCLLACGNNLVEKEQSDGARE